MHRAEIGVRRVKVAEGEGEGRKDWAACWNPALRASPVDWIPVGSRDNWLTSSVWSAISSSGERDCSAKFCARYKVCGLAETVVRPPRPPFSNFLGSCDSLSPFSTLLFSLPFRFTICARFFTFEMIPLDRFLNARELERKKDDELSAFYYSF